MALLNAKDAKVKSIAMQDARTTIDLDKIMEAADRLIKNDSGPMTGSIDVKNYKAAAIALASLNLRELGYGTNHEVGANYSHLVIWWNHA